MSGPTYLVFDNKQRVDIGVRVISYLEADRGAPSFYHVKDNRRRFGRIAFENIQGARKDAVTKVILHHDGTPDSPGCFRVLVQRNLSTHLMIDADGTVYQPLALRDIALHSGNFNNESVGIDLNNPVHPKRLRKNPAMLKERGVYSGRINGGKVHSLGYTDAQYRSLIAVVRGLMKIFPKLKPMAPIGLDNKVLRNKMEDLAFVGIVGHNHVSANKWDPGPGFDWERFLIGVRGNNFYFPITLKGTRNLAQIPKEKALNEAAPYFENTEMGRGGFFPVGMNQAWHSGIHLNIKEGTPVLAPADGRIVVARNTRMTKMGSPNMVLIRHDLKIDNQQRTFYSLLSHLQQEQLDKPGQSRIPWIRTLAQMDGPRGLPDDEDSDHPLSAPGFIALINHRAALLEVPVKAGEIVGYSGRYSPTTDGSEMDPLLDFAIFSGLPLFPRADTTFEPVDDDDGDDILCNARAVWKRYTQDPEALRGLVEGGYPLAPAEIRAFFGGTGGEMEDGRRPHEEMRWLACKHVLEWSDKTDFSGLFGGGVDFEWSTRKAAKRYIDRIRKFLWWDKRVTNHIKADASRLVWTYHPIALLTVLALGEARRALTPGRDGFMKGLSGEALRRAKKEDAELEREGGMDHRHVEIQTDGITGGEDIHEVEGVNPETEAWMRWEQGEWPPN